MASDSPTPGVQTETQQRDLPPFSSYPGYPPAYPMSGGAATYGYYPPVAYYPPPMSVQLSTWAITSLICSIVGIASLNIILALLGVIFGHVSLREIKAANGWREGRGMALAGTIVGYVGLGLALLVITFYVLYIIAFISFVQSIPPSPTPEGFVTHLFVALLQAR